MSSNEMPDIGRLAPDFFRRHGKHSIEVNPVFDQDDPLLDRAMFSPHRRDPTHVFINELQQLPKRPKFGFAGPKHQPNRRILKREIKGGRLLEYHATKGKRDYRA